ncbi:MAG: hypothetical protein ACKOQ1_06505 [Actinomycetota bacterium]
MAPIPRSTYVPDDLPDDVRWGFTWEALRKLVGHIHPIPMGQGLTQAYVDTYWPGLHFGDVMTMAKAAGAFVPHDYLMAGVYPAPHVRELHVLHDGTSRIITRDIDPGDVTQ